MQKLIHFIILIFFISCGSDPDYQEVMVNKTIKVYSQAYHKEAENYFFKWEPPIGPSNKPILFDLKNDILIFSPDLEGDYHIHLSITDISHEVIADEMFYYRAIAETLEVAIAETKPRMDIPTQSSVVKNPKNKIIKLSKSPQKQKKQSASKIENVHYTIQVAAWPSLEQARIDQLKLIEEGVDAYIQRNYRKEKDEIWYRVRIGNFSDKSKAQKMQEQIEYITGVESWIDVIPIEKK